MLGLAGFPIWCMFMCDAGVNSGEHW